MKRFVALFPLDSGSSSSSSSSSCSCLQMGTTLPEKTLTGMSSPAEALVFKWRFATNGVPRSGGIFTKHSCNNNPCSRVLKTVWLKFRASMYSWTKIKVTTRLNILNWSNVPVQRAKRLERRRVERIHYRHLVSGTMAVAGVDWLRIESTNDCTANSC